MKDAVLKSIRGARALIMAAAVGDFLPEARSRGKLEKSEVGALKLKKAPDILAEVGKRKTKPLLVGFAAEAGDNLKRAKDKLKRKGADVIVFNDVTAEGSGFGTDTNRVAIIDSKGTKKYPTLSKDEVAGLILDSVASSRG
jgi:phosphopantothenoylcysteine decarboxylase/phosphopantothenate--cysteine ligase